jgi:hypothetical protein
MPLYFFHFRHEDRTDEDPEGSVLSDIEAARKHAVMAAREFLAESVRFNRGSPPDAIVVVDQDGNELLTVFTFEVLPENLRKLLGGG